MYSKKAKTLTWKDICTPVVIAAWFTKAKIQKQPECLHMVEEWIKNVVCISTMEYHSAIKRSCHMWHHRWTLRTLYCVKWVREWQTVSSHLYVGSKTYRGKELIDTENRLIVTKNVGWEEGQMGKGGQKVQTSNYKINKS